MPEQPNAAIAIDSLYEQLMSLEQRIKKIEAHFDKIDLRLETISKTVRTAGVILSELK